MGGFEVLVERKILLTFVFIVELKSGEEYWLSNIYELIEPAYCFEFTQSEYFGQQESSDRNEEEREDWKHERKDRK